MNCNIVMPTFTAHRLDYFVNNFTCYFFIGNTWIVLSRNYNSFNFFWFVIFVKNRNLRFSIRSYPWKFFCLSYFSKFFGEFMDLLDGLNAERILIAAEAIGDARWFIEKAVGYAGERRVFDRAIGENQGIQFPIARAFAATEAADLMVGKAIGLFDAGEPCGAESNMAKLLAAEASWLAAEMCLQTHGGFGFAEEYDIERKFRETRLYQVAPISTNLILSYIAEHVLGLPRSF